MRKICNDKRDTDTRKEERKSEEGRHEIGWILVGEKGSMKKRNRKTHTNTDTHTHTHTHRHTHRYTD
jgi:hypothetical protein